MRLGVVSFDTDYVFPQIVCAILNKYYSFTQPFGSDWTFWYMRESSTALIAANLPLTWTLLQRTFNLKGFRDRYTSSRSGKYGSRFRSQTSTAFDERSRHRTRTVRETLASVIDRSDSEERMNPNPIPIPMKIYQKHEISVTTSPAGPEDCGHVRSDSFDTLPDGTKTVVNVKGGSPTGRNYNDLPYTGSEKIKREDV